MPVSVKRSTFKSKNPNIKHWLMVIPFILLLVGLAAAAFLLTTSQDLRQQAAGTTYIKCKLPTDCPNGSNCVGGTCTASLGGCRTGGKCAKGEVCDTKYNECRTSAGACGTAAGGRNCRDGYECVNGGCLREEICNIAPTRCTIGPFLCGGGGGCRRP